MAQVEKLQSEPDWGAVLNLRHIGMELLGESQVTWGSRARAWLGTESWSRWGRKKEERPRGCPPPGVIARGQGRDWGVPSGISVATVRPLR